MFACITTAGQMKANKSLTVPDSSTEEKIKNAARRIFHKKGFAATRTRDIAAETGINLALLNYYFRSKQKLFDIIMLETMQGFLQSIKGVFNDELTSFDHKITAIVNNYIDLLIAQPDIPLFILSELKTNPQDLLGKIGMKDILMKSHFLKQFKEAVKAGKIAPIHPMHFIMNLMSMAVFPFVASPMIMGLGELSQKDFNELMTQRKVLIPKWIKALLKAK
jgi:AcrR family transcriptional regulator